MASRGRLGKPHLLCELGGRDVSYGRVRTAVVVVGAPCRQHGARMGQRREQGLVQELVPEAADEALDEGVLGRLARRDVVPVDAALYGLSPHGRPPRFVGTQKQAVS